jgi:antitoxin HigA-1
MSRDIPLPHPGIALKEEFLEPMGLSVYALAKAIHVTRSRINDICLGRQGITAATALRLGRFFGVDPAWFMNMQSKYDLHVQAERLKAELAAIEPRPERMGRLALVTVVPTGLESTIRWAFQARGRRFICDLRYLARRLRLPKRRVRPVFAPVSPSASGLHARPAIRRC